MSLALAFDSFGASAVQVDEELYRFSVEGRDPDDTEGRWDLRVHAFSGREAMSEPYAFDVVVTSDAEEDEDLERLLLGRRATLSWFVGSVPRAYYGVVAGVRLEEVLEAPRSVRYHVRLVPALWLLEQKRRTRVFQGLTIAAIVDCVLGEEGIPTCWEISRDLPERDYCCQYEETDLRFVERLLAEAGIYYFFVSGSPLDASARADALVPGHTVVFGDDATAYPGIGSSDRSTLAGDAPALTFLRLTGAAVSREDKITRFVPASSVRPSAATYRDYDPERPMAGLASSAGSTQPFADLGTGDPGIEPLDLEVYDHHGPFLFPDWRFAGGEAALMLRQRRRHALLAYGASGCPDLAAGHRFVLAGHPAGHVNRAYVTTRVQHRGQAHHQGAGEWRRYENTFECVPAEVAYVPRRPKRKSVQVALTATVVGPPGEEIHVDAMGRIKVQFHWDRDGAYDGGSSCWIRTMQSMAGAAWGAQFIPRVGMEVVVVFEGGDPDKPMVLGCLNNGTHPPAFLLPVSKTRSGWRTQSSPGGDGFNELSFEDAAGNEQIYVHAARNLDMLIERDLTRVVKGGERSQIAGSSAADVSGNVASNVAGNVDERVAGDRTARVEGNRIDVVLGSSDERVTGSRVTRIDGKERRRVRGNADLEHAGDLTTRVLGCLTTIVGKADAKRSWVTRAEGIARLSSLESTEVSSDEELVLRVGKSSIRITSEKIEIISGSVTAKGVGGGISADDAGLTLTSKEDAKVLVEKKFTIKTSDGASLSMEKEVKLDGKKILLNSPAQAEDPPPKDPDPPTTVTLLDDAGKPLAYQRFLVTLEDGSEVSDTTDGDGKAELNIKGSGTVSFPDLSKTQPG